MENRIVVVGSINIDLVVSAPRIPLPGETVAGSNFQTFPGGKGANQAVAAARLGGRVSMIGKVGTDAFAHQLKTSLHQAGVDASAVRSAAASSGVALVTIDARGENSITVVAGANSLLTPQDLEAGIDLIRSAAILLCQLETPLATIEHLASIAMKENIPLMLDPSPAQSLPPTLLKAVEWLTPNETEAGLLLRRTAEEMPEEMLETTANRLLQLGCRNVAIKLGKRGSFLALADGTRQRLPAFQVDAVDSTAAGDTFNGAFAVALQQGKDALSAATWASAAAAISVTRHGAQPSMPVAAEVNKFIADQSGS